MEEEISQSLIENATIHAQKVENLKTLHNKSLDFQMAFPDKKAVPEVIVAEDDLVGVLWAMNGTHQREYLGIPATGKPVNVWMAEFMRISNGTITEYWPVVDGTDMLIDLGYLVHRNATNTTATTPQ
jgi:predicted ester cyclase